LWSEVLPMDSEMARGMLLAKPAAEETYPFDLVTLVAKVGGKMFGLLSLSEEPARLTLKCEPGYSALLRSTHPSIQPGYHMNKQHWNTLTLDGSLPPDLVQELIDESYRLVVQSLPRAARVALQRASEGDGGAAAE